MLLVRQTDATTFRMKLIYFLRNKKLQAESWMQTVKRLNVYLYLKYFPREFYIAAQLPLKKIYYDPLFRPLHCLRLFIFLNVVLVPVP